MITEHTFGKPLPEEHYLDRPGAYLVAIEDGTLHVIRRNDGKYFLPGGGLEEQESHEACILRECIEETGYDVAVEDFVTSADQYFTHPSLGGLHLIQYYYSGTFIEQLTEPKEQNAGEHIKLPLSQSDRLESPMQRFAVEQCLEMLRADAHGSDDEDL